MRHWRRKMIEGKELPKDWKLVKLGDIATYINGKAFKPTEWSKKGIPIIRIQNLNRDKSIYNYCNFPVDKKYYVNNGDLLFAWSGTPDTSFGAHIWKGEKAVLNQHIFRIVVDENKITKFYYLYALNHKVKEFVSKAHGTAGLAHITKKKFEESEISLPPLPEQNLIVAKLEELLSELEKGKEQLHTALDQLRVYRQSVLKYAFEGKLTNKNVRDGELPKGWKVCPISNIAEINPKLPNKEDLSPNLEVQFLPMKLVEEIINRINLNEIRLLSEVQKGSYTPFINGDVIFAKVTPCMENGKIAIVENLKNGIGYGSSEFHVIRPIKEVINKYIFYFVVQDRFRNEAANAMTGAVGLRRVPKQFIENHTISIPSIQEQKLIIEEIEDRLSVADKLEETITASLQQSETLRQSILKKAFEGKLV